jgi:DNA-directed RNA polymerase specialized sigma24 family protein
VVARNTLANHRRTTQRGDRLRLELTALERMAAPQPAVAHTVIDRAAMLAALAALSALERDAVLLIAWDGLAACDAALVAGLLRTSLQRTSPPRASDSRVPWTPPTTRWT